MLTHTSSNKNKFQASNGEMKFTLQDAAREVVRVDYTIVIDYSTYYICNTTVI
jgi:hypothetical protein